MKSFIKPDNIYFYNGPRIITANVDNDAGGITTYALVVLTFDMTFSSIIHTDDHNSGHNPGDGANE